MNKQELEAKLKKADTELGEAIIVVARRAQDVSDNSYVMSEGTYGVEPDDMVELKNALTHWTACTQKFLEVVDEVGEFNRAQQVAQ